jgi:hypothetical protein
MIRVRFNAARSLTGNHAVGDEVTIEFSAAQPLTPGREVSRDVQKALGGARETLHHYGARTWSITTEPLAGAELSYLFEFLDSVEGGEQFAFEPWSYDLGPSLDLDFTTARYRIGEEINAFLSSEGYSLTLVAAEGTGGADDSYQVSFTVVEVP